MAAPSRTREQEVAQERHGCDVHRAVREELDADLRRHLLANRSDGVRAAPAGTVGVEGRDVDGHVVAGVDQLRAHHVEVGHPTGRTLATMKAASTLTHVVPQVAVLAHGHAAASPTRRAATSAVRGPGNATTAPSL
jgi:hypothetical protein